MQMENAKERNKKIAKETTLCFVLFYGYPKESKANIFFPSNAKGRKMTAKGIYKQAQDPRK